MIFADVICFIKQKDTYTTIDILLLQGNLGTKRYPDNTLCVPQPLPPLYTFFDFECSTTLSSSTTLRSLKSKMTPKRLEFNLQGPFDWFIFKNYIEAHMNRSKEILICSNCKKSCPKASKTAIFSKKGSFPAKKSCKI